MRAFRVVFLDEAGRVVDFQDVRFQDDKEAIAQVRDRRHRTPIELWESGRFICRFDPGGDRR